MNGIETGKVFVIKTEKLEMLFMNPLPNTKFIIQAGQAYIIAYFFRFRDQFSHLPPIV